MGLFTGILDAPADVVNTLDGNSQNDSNLGWAGTGATAATATGDLVADPVNYLDNNSQNDSNLGATDDVAAAGQAVLDVPADAVNYLDTNKQNDKNLGLVGSLGGLWKVGLLLGVGYALVRISEGGE